jgi:hypothetical protein
MYVGPPTFEHVWRFVNQQCSKAAHVGRVYVADILAAQFVAASTAAARRHLRWQYTAGRDKPVVQRYFRYYLDIMEACPRTASPCLHFALPARPAPLCDVPSCLCACLRCVTSSLLGSDTMHACVSVWSCPPPPARCSST